MTKMVDCVPILKARADPTRWQIVRELLGGSLTVSDLTKRVHATQNNISKHVRVLREAGIVTTWREGKHVRCGIEKALQIKAIPSGDQLDLGCCSFRF
jgi:DNA-binding transcriptional ArsR family regulator